MLIDCWRNALGYRTAFAPRASRIARAIRLVERRGGGGLRAALCTAVLGAALQANAADITEISAPCQGCHGEQGHSVIANIPSLAGQPEFFIMNQLFLMREGVRRVEPMKALVASLSDDDLQALAKYFSKAPPKPSDEVIDPELAKRGAALANRARCASCHLPSLAGQEQMPRLAGQRIDYLRHALTDLRDSQRPGADSNMIAAIGAASDADIDALAHYAASVFAATH